MERENRSFWDILIWVTVLTGGLFGLAGLMMKVAGIWSLIIYSLIPIICSIIHIIHNRKAGKPMQRDLLGDLLFVATVAGVVFTLVVLDEKLSPYAWWFVPPLVILISFTLYKDDQRLGKERQEEEKRRREPYLVRDREIKSAQKVFILISHAEKVRILSRVSSQMYLYTLPDDRFLILFKEPVGMDKFLKAVATFRTRVDADEDVIGYYGPADSGSGAAYVSTLAGESRTVPFDPDPVPLDGAIPVW